MPIVEFLEKRRSCGERYEYTVAAQATMLAAIEMDFMLSLMLLS